MQLYFYYYRVETVSTAAFWRPQQAFNLLPVMCVGSPFCRYSFRGAQGLTFVAMLGDTAPVGAEPETVAKSVVPRNGERNGAGSG